MFRAPVNNVIVRVETKYIGNISNIMRMSAIQQGASVDPVDVVQIVGEIVSLPIAIDNKKEHDGFSCKDLRVGDLAIFSHSVIYSFVQTEPDADPIYKNRIFYKGKEYFACDIQNLFGVIRDCEIIMVNGYAMLYDFPDQKIILSTVVKRRLSTTETELMHIGHPRENQPTIDANSGESVYFNPAKTIKYQIAGKPFRIIQQQHIMGKTFHKPQ